MPKSPWFETLPGYAWDTRMKGGRYRVILPDGRLGALVARDTIVGLIRDVHDASAARFGLLAQDAVAGLITPADFQQAMMLELRHLYNASSALAVGGYNNMTAVEWGRNGQILRGEYAYLAGFAQDIADGKLTPAQADARARLYAGKAYSRFWAEHTLTQQAAGFTEERWNTAADERVCEGGNRLGCAGLGALGWVPIGTLPNPGDGSTECLGACRCDKEYR
jgi:hypothetical protein